MATAPRDYYEVLGVPRDADEREIKRAFRTLARDLHPDVSDHPDAEERFREAAAAYEVLSKPDTRELYDRYGHDGLRTGGFQPTDFDFTSVGDIFSALFGEDIFGTGGAGRPSRGRDILAEVEIELTEAAEGVTREVSFPVTVACATCDGSGAEPGTETETCTQCGGSGRLQSVSQTVFGQFVRTQACNRCGGTGRTIPHPCATCRGAGQVREERTVEVEIPPGIHDGQRIRLAGEGDAAGTGGRAGDLYVHVGVRADPRFVRDRNDVVSSVDLTMTQAALGATMTVPTLDGDTELELDAGTQPGAVVQLRGKGMPVLQGFGRGDHRIVVNVLVPRHLTDEQRGVLEEFERSATDETYRADEGFFSRLRAAFR